MGAPRPAKWSNSAHVQEALRFAVAVGTVSGRRERAVTMETATMEMGAQALAQWSLTVTALASPSLRVLAVAMAELRVRNNAMMGI
jgi:hypothetical protein